jgi:hypothetical protein
MPDADEMFFTINRQMREAGSVAAKSNLAFTRIPQQGKVMKKLVIGSLSALLVTSIAVGYELHHPNLRDAYAAADSAIHHVQEAQANNKGVEFGGHAGKAIDLLKQAQVELIEGDKWNDAHRK